MQPTVTVRRTSCGKVVVLRTSRLPGDEPDTFKVLVQVLNPEGEWSGVDRPFGTTLEELSMSKTIKCHRSSYFLGHRRPGVVILRHVPRPPSPPADSTFGPAHGPGADTEYLQANGTWSPDLWVHEMLD